MRIYQGTIWSIETHDWSLDQDETCVTLTPPEGKAALQFSAHRKRSGGVTTDDLISSLREYVPETTPLVPVRCGTFWGYHGEYLEEGRCWRMWDLAYGQTELFVTFNCPEEHQHVHRGIVDWLLSTLDGSAS